MNIIYKIKPITKLYYILIMNFTFGIVTSSDIYLNQIIDSIEKQNISSYEIILIGNPNIELRKNIKKIYFDETKHNGWITKKKNIIAQNAKYENIVFMHDYIILEDGWYKGFCKYGNNFDIIVNKIINYDGTRFRDWILNYHFLTGLYLHSHNNISIHNQDTWLTCGENVLSKYSDRILILDNKGTLFLDYNDEANDLQPYIYISGSYFVVKKKVILAVSYTHLTLPTNVP
jgi:hypothetical protein